MTSSENPKVARISISEIAPVYRALAEQHAAARQTEDAERAWKRLEQRPPKQGRIRVRQARVWIASAAIAAGVAGAVWWSTPEALTYTVDGRQVTSGSAYAGSGPADVRFSDDSRIMASEESTFYVSVVGEDAALTRLERGKLSVEVVEHQDTDWRFLAGPYEVQVTGTAFDLSWSPDDRHFQIAMHHGSVTVVGPGLERRTVEDGQSLSLVDARMAELKQPVTAPASPDAAEPTSRDIGNEQTQPPSVGAPKPRASKVDTVPDRAEAAWPDLVAQGRFSEVVDAAEASGLDSVLGSASADELKALAHSALYSGQTKLALRTWRTVRNRFATSGAGRQAPFFIGRIHQEAGRTAEAMRSLDTYLSESPSGVYASEAAGRRLALVRQVQGDAAGRRAAREYLKRYPSGAYAKTARDMLALE